MRSCSSNNPTKIEIKRNFLFCILCVVEYHIINKNIKIVNKARLRFEDTLDWGKHI